MQTVSQLADSIKQRRRLLKISQENLALVSGVSLRSLKAIEKGKANPTWNQLAKILAAMGWEMELRERSFTEGRPLPREPAP